MIEQFRLSQKDKDHLIKIKRWTKVKHWNVLCRWAFCLSLATETAPPDLHVASGSNVEMTWRTFTGPHHYAYEAALIARCLRDGLGTDPDTLTRQFRLHLSRGLGYLATGDRGQGIGSLLEFGLGK